MGFQIGAFAKVWEIRTDSDKKTSLKVSISQKKRDSEEYEQKFSGWISCVGTAAAQKAAKVGTGSRIRLGNIDVENKYDKEKNTTYVNYIVYSFFTDNEEMFSAKKGDLLKNLADPNSTSKKPAQKAPDSGEVEPTDNFPF